MGHHQFGVVRVPGLGERGRQADAEGVVQDRDLPVRQVAERRVGQRDEVGRRRRALDHELVVLVGGGELLVQHHRAAGNRGHLGGLASGEGHAEGGDLAQVGG